MAKTKKEVKIKTLTFTCSSCGEFTVDIDRVYFYGDSSDCEMCGSHGSISVSAECKCGKSFDIELDSW